MSGGGREVKEEERKGEKGDEEEDSKERYIRRGRMKKRLAKEKRKGNKVEESG